MPSRELERLAGGCGEAREERLDEVGVEDLALRQLPQDRTQLGAEGEDTGCEEVRQPLLGVAQAEHVRHVPGALDREDEILGHLGPPAKIALRTLQRVERPVELRTREVLADVLELATLRETLRIEVAAPADVLPPGDADADATVRSSCGHGCTILPGGPTLEPGWTQRERG